MNILNWLITSSADPKKTSLMVKGALVLGGSQLVRLFDMACTYGLSCLAVDITFINELAEGAEMLVYAVMLLVGAVWFLVGLGRKFYLARWSAKE